MKKMREEVSMAPRGRLCAWQGRTSRLEGLRGSAHALRGLLVSCPHMQGWDLCLRALKGPQGQGPSPLTLDMGCMLRSSKGGP